MSEVLGKSAASKDADVADLIKNVDKANGSARRDLITPETSIAGTAAEPDQPTLLGIVAKMLAVDGVYIGGDTDTPEATVPLSVVGGEVWSIKLDQKLDPGRFLESFTVHGPYQADMWASGSARIHAERQRQITEKGYSAEQDDEYGPGYLSLAGICYARCAVEQTRGREMALAPPDWPWHQGAWKPSDDPVRNLEKAGALFAAEIDRLVRLKAMMS